MCVLKPALSSTVRIHGARDSVAAATAALPPQGFWGSVDVRAGDRRTFAQRHVAPLLVRRLCVNAVLDAPGQPRKRPAPPRPSPRRRRWSSRRSPRLPSSTPDATLLDLDVAVDASVLRSARPR